MTREALPQKKNSPATSEPSIETSPVKPDKKTMQLMLSQMPIDFWARDAEHRRVVFQSDRSIETWGDLKGTTFDESDFPPELVAEWNEGINQALEGKTVHHESILPVSPEEKRAFRKTFGPIRNGDNETLGVLGICVDVTEQKEKERLLTARRKLAEQLNKTLDCAEALRYCFETALHVSRVQIASIFAVNGEEAVGTLMFHQGHSEEFVENYSTLAADPLLKEAAARGKPLVRNAEMFSPDLKKLLYKRRVGEVAHFPMCQNGQMIALLSVASSNNEKFPQWSIDELETIATQTETTISRIRTQEKLRADRRLLRQLLQMQEQERQLLSSEIHDGFVQDVVGAQMVLETAMQTCDHHHSNCARLFDQASTMLGRAIKEARRLISDLRPLIIEEAGVVEAINFLINRVESSSPLKIFHEHDEVIERFDPIVEGVVFRIVQEAVTNAIRHSKGTSIRINISESDKLLTLKITDDGVGFDPTRIPENRFGIRGITERASLFDGVAKIISQPGQGTEILVKLPITRLPELPRPELTQL